jgi:putative transposase
MVALAGVSRASYYRFDPEAAGPVRDVELRDAIQRIALRFPAYGRPRITAELKRQGWAVNHKRVGRILREDNLLCLRKRKFVVTTDSEHDFRVYPNLARGFIGFEDTGRLIISPVAHRPSLKRMGGRRTKW